MSILSFALASLSEHPVLTFTTSLAVLLLIRTIYRIYLHPLSHIPGPILPKATSLWLYYHAYTGDEASTIHALHLHYGPYVRVSPNEVDVSDADAIAPIYVLKGGFPKAACYANFDIDGHKTIFSTTDHKHRAPRVKAVMPMFSTQSLRENEDAIRGCVNRMVKRLDEEAKKKRSVNVLNLTRGLAVDAVTSHLFREDYGGTTEDGPTLSVSAFVDAFVAVGRFFYLPNTLFAYLDWAITKIYADHETDQSMGIVDKYVESLVAKTSPESSTYQGRLLAAGLGEEEVKAQCKDLVFAGTDSTGMNASIIIQNLVRYPEKYERLQKEVEANQRLDDAAAPVQALPYLNAIVKEALRISMANPTRLPHVVPHSGWFFKGTHFPAGTIVGCAPFELHFKSSPFPDPREFVPERWLDVSEEMQRNYIPFGAGSRMCIARNLATLELQLLTEKLGMSGVLNGAKAEPGDVQILEWFNSRVKGESIEVAWG